MTEQPWPIRHCCIDLVIASLTNLRRGDCTMEDVLKRLLDTEAQAEAIIAAAEAERKTLLDVASAEVLRAEKAFLAGAPERRQAVLQAAAQRAAQLAEDVARKFQSRQRALRESAERNEAAAVQAALVMLLDPDA